MKRISVDEIIDIEKKLSTDIYGELFTKWREEERYYELDFLKELNLPDEYAGDGIVLPTARDMVDNFVDHIDVNNARVYVNRKGTSAISAEDSEMMRKFYLGMMYITNVESDISPWRVAAKHFALHGLAVLKTIWDADRWPDKPIRGEESNDDYEEKLRMWRQETSQSIPIIIQAVNPMCVMPDPAYSGRRFVIEKHIKMCLDVTTRWEHWSNPKKKKPEDDVEFISYWDDTYRSDLVDGEPILKVKGGVAKHNYGFIPYVFIDSGLGNISFEAKPEMRYVGMLRYMMPLLVSESRSYSIAETILKQEAWPWYTLEGENANLVTNIDKKYGKGNKLPEGVKYVPQSPQLPPEALATHQDRTAFQIAAHAAPRSVRGLPEQGVRSGAHFREIRTEGAIRYACSEPAFKHGAAKVLGNCARLFKNVVQGDIRVWARGSTPADEFDEIIKKDKMKEPFTPYVEFAPFSEEDEYRRHDDLIRLKASGLGNNKWGWQQMPNVDPEAMEFENEKEKIRNAPGYMQMKDEYATGKLAEAISKRQQAEALEAGIPLAPPGGAPQGQGMPQGGQMMGPMTTGIPNRAIPGSAEDMQNKLRQMRSQTPMSATQGQGGGGARGATR